MTASLDTNTILAESAVMPRITSSRPLARPFSPIIAYHKDPTSSIARNAHQATHFPTASSENAGKIDQNRPYFIYML